MPRITEYNDKFLYTKTDPNKIIAAKKGALFFRRDNKFFLNLDGNFNSNWTLLPFRTVVYPVPDLDKPIRYEHPYEIWEKISDGHKDEYGDLLPKTDWKFYSCDDAFLSNRTKSFHWIFPPPINSVDPCGENNNRSYDENFFYVKTLGYWVRTPIHIYDVASVNVPETSYWYSNLPFVDYPRRTPPPNGADLGINGDQSYDRDFFYVKPSSWKRTPLNYFDLSKMTRF